MKKTVLALITLIIVGMIIPMVSAELIINESLIDFTDTSMTGELSVTAANYRSDGILTGFSVRDVSLFDEISYFTLEVYGTQGYWPSEELIPEGRHETTYTYNGETKPAVIYVSRSSNWAGSIISTKYIFFPQDWDRQGLSGVQVINTPLNLVNARFNSNDLYWAVDKSTTTTNLWLCNANGDACGVFLHGADFLPRISHATAISWVNNLRVTETDDDEFKGYTVDLIRTVNGITAYSEIEIYQNTSLIYRNAASEDISLWYPQNDINKINVTSPVRTWSYDLNLETPDDPDDPTDPTDTVTVYVRNSQTGAAIANSRVVIDALVDGEYYPVINRTEPSGIFSMTLQPTGGGPPNPDGYRLITSAEGYISVLPYLDFEVDGVTTIYEYLDPISGGPEDENNTFIDFYVRDLAANAISGATVNFGGYTLITNSAGYAVVEVGKNATYTYTVSKSGYGHLTGNVVIGADPRHTINTVLAPSVTPTTQTPIPTGTAICPTPTLTAPTGEPVSNWLEWFAAHFGMILGGGVEIGKIFMWLCFVVPVGVYVGKEAKAGAAGFMAGAGIVTLFFVLIGWVPMWLVVLLALIIGLLYAKLFNNSDNGGGR